jgi:endonuclease/exonuclease/phosphatase family metal-dependent hydrolase
MSLITLASLNLHGGLTSQGRPFDVAAACHSLKADVIAVQEAWRPAGQPDTVNEIAAALARRLAAAAGPTVIVGDLNLPGGAALFAPGYRPVVRGRTFPADRPLIQLDHMLIRGGVTASGGEVLAPAGSDHLPIRAQLSVG